jgi:hypothetical protein
MKYEKLAVEIKIMSKLNNVSIYPLVVSAEGVINQKLPKISREYGFNQKHLESTTTKMSYITQIPNDTPLDLEGIG